MPTDSLYCLQCGEDIHIVPDFDPELDYQMQQVWIEALREAKLQEETEGSGAANMTPTEVIRTENENHIKTAKGVYKGYGRQRRKGVLQVVLWSLFAAFAFALGVFVVIMYQYTSYDYQVRRGSQDVEAMRYQDAIGHFNRALELKKDNQELRFSLANVYLQQGNKVEYEYQLRKILEDPTATSEQLEMAYHKLIQIYQSREDFQTINELIKASKSQEIQETYQKYIANVPEFSYPEDEYREIIPLKLTASTQGVIYYTTDGSEPDTNSTVYDSPIFLDNGTHTIKACFQNQYGIMSDCVTRTYHVVIEQLSSPEVDVESGDYTRPMWIQVLGAWEGDVYYTTDGTAPDQNAQLYTHPIPMPLGVSQYRFALVGEDGRVGAITDREYQLTLDTAITPDDAGRIASSAMETLRGEDAHLYQYQVMYAASLDDQGDYYVIAESYLDEQSNFVRTGSYVAVDIYQGICYRLQITDGRNYTLLEAISQAVPSQEENIN
jgi:tetratricopeptide (TPR) repeat protein